MHKLNISMDIRVNRMKVEKLEKSQKCMQQQLDDLEANNKSNIEEEVFKDKKLCVDSNIKDDNADDMEKLKSNLEYLDRKIEYLKSDNEEKSDTLEALDLAAETIDMGNNFHPFKLLGFTCSYELAYSIAYFVTGFFAYVIHAFVSNTAQANYTPA